MKTAYLSLLGLFFFSIFFKQIPVGSLQPPVCVCEVLE